MSKHTELRITFRSRKAGREEVVDFNDLPIASQEAIIRYGAQRFVNDKLGGSEVTTEDASAGFDKIVKQLMDGWVGRQSRGGSVLSSLDREIIKLAKDRIKVALKARKLTIKDLPDGKMDELVTSMIERDQAELEEKAKAILKAKEMAAPSADFELGDLGL